MNSPHLERGGLPIREVTRLTGVHPVTLRAWERRYGLVVPQRTGKGHRLYSEEQVERIRRILVWLERGVAISQVRALLERPEETPAADVESPWERLHEQLLDAIAALAERRLDDLFNQAASLYPVATLCEKLLQPLLQHLERRWQGQFGARMERAFFFSWLRSKLGAAFITSNGCNRARRCCWSTSPSCRWNRTSGCAAGCSAAARCRCRSSTGRCHRPNWPWPANAWKLAACCCTPVIASIRSTCRACWQG